MNDFEIVKKLFADAGLVLRDADAINVYIEDPACILSSFETFVDYAWAIITVITCALVMGWGWMMIRGIKVGIMDRIKNLIIILGILSVAYPIVNIIYGDNLFGRGCKSIPVSIENVNKILEMRAEKQSRNPSMYEDINIYDSGPSQSVVNKQPEKQPDENLINRAEAVAGNAAVPQSANGATTTTGVANNGNTNTGNKNNSVNNSPMSFQTTSATNFVGPSVNYATMSGGGIPTRVRDYVEENFVGTRGARTAVKVDVNDAAGEVIYTMADGTRLVKRGGSKAWRNNNPGNLRISASQLGQARGMAVFPDLNAAKKATKDLLRGPKYNNLTLGAAIARYAPASDNNNPNGYAAKLSRLLGVGVNTPLNKLNDDQIWRMIDGIWYIEGWREGDIKKL